MKRIRIVLAGISGVALEVMEAILASHPEFHIAGRVPADDGIAAAIRHYRADVLVIMQPGGSGCEVSVERVFRQRPARIVTITSDGKNGTLHVLRPHATPLPDLSVNVLVDAVRSTGSPA